MSAIPTMVGGADTQRHQILARLIYTKEPFSEKKKKWWAGVSGKMS